MPKQVEGTPYSVNFVGDEDGETISRVYTLIEPPIELERVKKLLDAFTLPFVKIEEIASTQTRTFLELTMNRFESGTPDYVLHDSAVERVQNDFTEAISALNSIEAGDISFWNK